MRVDRSSLHPGYISILLQISVKVIRVESNNLAVANVVLPPTAISHYDNRYQFRDMLIYFTIIRLGYHLSESCSTITVIALVMVVVTTILPKHLTILYSLHLLSNNSRFFFCFILFCAQLEFSTRVNKKTKMPPTDRQTDSKKKLLLWLRWL